MLALGETNFSNEVAQIEVDTAISDSMIEPYELEFIENGHRDRRQLPFTVRFTPAASPSGTPPSADALFVEVRSETERPFYRIPPSDYTPSEGLCYSATPTAHKSKAKRCVTRKRKAVEIEEGTGDPVKLSQTKRSKVAHPIHPPASPSGLDKSSITTAEPQPYARSSTLSPAVNDEHPIHTLGVFEEGRAGHYRSKPDEFSDSSSENSSLEFGFQPPVWTKLEERIDRKGKGKASDQTGDHDTADITSQCPLHPSSEPGPCHDSGPGVDRTSNQPDARGSPHIHELLRHSGLYHKTHPDVFRGDSSDDGHESIAPEDCMSPCTRTEEKERGHRNGVNVGTGMVGKLVEKLPSVPFDEPGSSQGGNAPPTPGPSKLRRSLRPRGGLSSKEAPKGRRKR